MTRYVVRFQAVLSLEVEAADEGRAIAKAREKLKQVPCDFLEGRARLRIGETMTYGGEISVKRAEQK